MRLDAPEPAALGHVTGYLHEFHVVEANAALPSAAHVVAGVAAAAKVGIVTEEGAHRGAAGLGHVSVNHSPTLRGGIRHRSSDTPLTANLQIARFYADAHARAMRTEDRVF